MQDLMSKKNIFQLTKNLYFDLKVKSPNPHREEKKMQDFIKKNIIKYTKKTTLPVFSVQNISPQRLKDLK